MEYLQLCRERLNLQSWSIHVLLTDVPNRHDDRSIALTSTIAGSVSAYIRLRDDIAPNRDGYCTITHEVLHLAFARLDWEIDYCFSKQSESLREELWHAYTPGYETGIDHLAEALALQWMPGDVSTQAPGEQPPATGEPASNHPPDVG
jgi:hypothetical protein